MEQFNLQKNSGHIVSCVKSVPETPAGIVIAVHGFSSSKEGSTYQLLLKRFPEAGFGAVCIDLPGHGTGESAMELLRIPGALDSIEAVEKYVQQEYPGCEISYFGSSFGAYLTGLYLSTREHTGRKAFWRSAAVNMPELMLMENPTEEEKQYLKELETKGYYDTNLELHSPVRITMDLLNDFREYDLFETFAASDADFFREHRIAMAHGEEDDVINPDAARDFAARFDIPVTWFPGEGHSLANDSATPEKVMELAVALYRS